MIRLWCDHCGEEIPPRVNGGVRFRTSARELSFHLCAEHQGMLRTMIVDFCGKHPPREVTPTIKKP